MTIMTEFLLSLTMINSFKVNFLLDILLYASMISVVAFIGLKLWYVFNKNKMTDPERIFLALSFGFGLGFLIAAAGQSMPHIPTHPLYKYVQENWKNPKYKIRINDPDSYGKKEGSSHMFLIYSKGTSDEKLLAKVDCDRQSVKECFDLIKSDPEAAIKKYQESIMSPR